jgi:hypothetical protein
MATTVPLELSGTQGSRGRKEFHKNHVQHYQSDSKIVVS